MQPSAQVVPFEIEETPPTVITVHATDGMKYEVKMAMVVNAVIDTGQKNPLDGTPIFSIQAQTVTQINRRTDG